jgi:hypothetical protein
MASSGSEPPASSPVAPATVVIVIIPPAAPAPRVVAPPVRPLPIDFFFCKECGNFRRYSTTCVECDLVGCAECQPRSATYSAEARAVAVDRRGANFGAGGWSGSRGMRWERAIKATKAKGKGGDKSD